MNQKSSQAAKLVKNSSVSLVQIVLGTAITLFTTRLLIKHLGFTDFGLLTALGASGFYSAIFLNAINIAALRHMAFEVGLPNKGELKSVFSSSILIYFCLGLLLVTLGFLLEDTVLATLTIPEERRAASRLVYRFVVLQMAVGSIAAPFYAIRQAHQDLVAVAIYQMLNQILFLALLVLIPLLAWDALVVVSAGTLLINSVVNGCLVLHCWISYPEVHPQFSAVRVHQCKRIASFAKWSAFSMVALQMQTQLAVIAMNVFFGPIVNAAYAIGNSVNGFVMRLTGALHSALQPAMTSTHAQGDGNTLNRMISISSRYSTYFILPVVIPLILEMETCLWLWINKYPDQAPLFSRLIVFASLIGTMSNGYGMAVNSLNRLAESVMIFAPLQFGAFAISIAGIHFFNAPAWTLPAWAILAVCLQTVAYPLYFGASTGFGLRRWLIECAVPIFVVATIGFFPAMLIRCLELDLSTPLLSVIGSQRIAEWIDPAVIRLMVETLVSSVALAWATWKFGIRQDEKVILGSLVRQRFQRFRAVINNQKVQV